MLKYILIFGSIRFLIELIIHQFFYQTGWIHEPWSGSVLFLWGLFFTVIYAVGIIFYYKKHSQGLKDMPHLFVLVAGTIIFSEFLSSFYDAWFSLYYDPDFSMRYVENLKQKFPEYAKGQGYSQEEINAFYKEQIPAMIKEAKKQVTYWDLLKERIKAGGVQSFFIGGMLAFILRDRKSEMGLK